MEYAVFFVIVTLVIVTSVVAVLRSPKVIDRAIASIALVMFIISIFTAYYFYPGNVGGIWFQLMIFSLIAALFLMLIWIIRSLIKPKYESN